MKGIKTTAQSLVIALVNKLWDGQEIKEDLSNLNTDTVDVVTSSRR